MTWKTISFMGIDTPTNERIVTICLIICGQAMIDKLTFRLWSSMANIEGVMFWANIVEDLGDETHAIIRFTKATMCNTDETT